MAASNSPQPTSIRTLYFSYLLIEGFDCGLYLAASPFMLMGRSEDLSAGLTRAFMRANGVCTPPINPTTFSAEKSGTLEGERVVSTDAFLF
jgi:hypothetical protein